MKHIAKILTALGLCLMFVFCSSTLLACSEKEYSVTIPDGVKVTVRREEVLRHNGCGDVTFRTVRDFPLTTGDKVKQGEEIKIIYLNPPPKGFENIIYVNGNVVGNGSAFMVGNKNIAVSLGESKIDYSVSTSVSANGSISVSPTANYEDTVTITLLPETGYWLKEGTLKHEGHWLHEGSQDFRSLSVTNIFGNTATFTMPSGNVTIQAEFEKIVRTYTLDYKNGIASSSVQDITLSYDNFGASFPVPERRNSIFHGWYLDSDRTIPVSDAKGNLIIGREIFDHGSKTLYAKWSIINEAEVPTYPVLMVFVTEVQADLKRYNGDEISVYYKMTELERDFCELITVQISKQLNDMFDGLVLFEVDNYFTTELVQTDQMGVGVGGPFGGQYYDYYPNVLWIPELNPILQNYRSVITSYCLDDYEFFAHSSGGFSDAKYGYYSLESAFHAWDFSSEKYFDFTLQETVNKWEPIKDVYVHEFTHTVEIALQYTGQDVLGYHEMISVYWKKDIRGLDFTRLYLLNQAELNGESAGIPFECWGKQPNVLVIYNALQISAHPTGKIYPVIDIVGEKTDDRESLGGWDDIIPSGSYYAVEAIPNEGYRFVMWMDGVKTPIRYDANITSNLTMYAIFEKE